MTTPFDTADARLLALVASQTPTAGHALDRAALISTILDACAEVERLRAALSKAHRRAQAAEGLIRRTGIADDIDAIDPARLLDVLTNRATERYHDQTRAVCAENERLRALLAASDAECARLGAAACDAKWDLLP